MQDWAKLTPQQRDAARARYRALSKLTPEQRREIVRQWTESQEAQQALPTETTPLPEAAEATKSAETAPTADALQPSDAAPAPAQETPPAPAQ